MKFSLKYLSYTPILLLIWIVVQVSILAKYNALIFFSWGQVINDTIAILFWYIPMILWVFFTSSNLYPNTSKIYRFLQIFWTIIVWFVVFIVAFNLKQLWVSMLSIFFVIWIILKITWAFKDDNDKISGNKRLWALPMMLFLLVLIALISTFFFNFLNKGKTLLIDKNSIWTFNYMNDRFIIYTNTWWLVKIIPNSWNISFDVEVTK